MAAAGPWVVYNDAKLNGWKGLFNLPSDSFKVALFTSASVAISATVTPATYSSFAADAHEVANGNGYTTGGVSAVSPTLTGGGATGTITFDTADVSWTASGAGFTARAAVIYDTTTGYAIAYCLLDSTPADVTVASGNTLTIQIANVFQETGN
jgi:hypothetical protein